MKRTSLLILTSLLLFTACATGPKIQDRTTDEAMLNFLPYLNQKVTGYLDANQVEKLNAQTYKEIVDEVCGPWPSCRKDATVMFETYSVQPRKLDGMFSVMLCDKVQAIKTMEDFSCNEQKVEIPSFQIDSMARCAFEDKWKERIVADCMGLK